MGNVSLKVLEKSLNFLLKKGYKPCLVILSEHKISFILLAHGAGYIMQRIIYFSDYFKTRFGDRKSLI